MLIVEHATTQTPNTDGMVALLPTTNDWCKQELAHCTVVFLGDITGRSPAEFNDLGKLASSVAQVTAPFGAKALGTDVLGDPPVDVLLLDPSPQLKAIRSFFEMWDTGDFPTYLPHATIGPSGGVSPNPDFLPMVLAFDPSNTSLPSLCIISGDGAPQPPGEPWLKP